MEFIKCTVDEHTVGIFVIQIGGGEKEFLEGSG